MATVPTPLQGIPEDIEHHRRRMFSLEEPVHFTPAVFERYFPFIDNVWTFKHYKGVFTNGIETIRGACRLDRKPANNRSANMRSRKQREGTGTCHAKFKLSVLPNGIRVLEKVGDTAHSHDLDYIDSIKRNSGVRNIVLHDFFKSWDAAAILAYLRDTAQNVGGRDLLTEAGGHYINRNEVSNVVNRALRTAYPGQDPTEIKRQQDKYKAYKTCSVKGCMAAPFPSSKELAVHIRDMHGLQKHDHTRKLPCPEPSCSRRKPSRGFPSVSALEAHQRRCHGTEPATLQNPTEGGAEAEVLAIGERKRAAAGEEDEPDAEMASGVAGDSISAPARRHMEERLAHMQRERRRLGAEIQALQEKLYGGGGRISDDEAVVHDAAADDSDNG